MYWLNLGMIVIDGVVNRWCFVCRLYDVINIGVFDLIKYVWLFNILVLNDLNLFKDWILDILLIV